MTICPHCGVEVADTARACPLCERPLDAAAGREGPAGPHRGADGSSPRAAAPAPDPREARRRVRRWLLELFTLLAVTGSAVVLIIDLATGGTLDWAHYPLAGLWFLWLVALVPQFLWGRPALVFLAEVAAVVAFLAMLDRLTGGAAWFLPLALPLTVLTATLLGGTLAFIRRGGRSPFAAIAGALLAAAVFTVGLELLVNRFPGGDWRVSWSPVVLGCTLPLVGLLLYLRRWYRRRQAELRKLLHM